MSDWELLLDCDWSVDLGGDWELAFDSVWEVGAVPVLNSEKTSRYPGVHPCPEGREYLERALVALEKGLPVRAWAWAVRAVDELDRLTDAPGDQDQDQDRRKSTKKYQIAPDDHI